MALDSDVIERLKALESPNGEIEPTAVVDDARADTSPLHPHFEWEDSVAAEAYRLDQARALIRRVTFKVITTEIMLDAPYYVHNPDLPAREQGYVSVARVRTEQERALAALHNEIDRTRYMVERVRRVAAGLNLTLEAEHLLRTIV